MKVSGKTIHVRANNRDIYDKLCNLSYFEKFLPEQVKDWEAGDEITFFE